MSKLDNKIKDEYVNYTEIYSRLNDLPFFKDYKTKNGIYKLLQMMIEDRILYRYKIKSPPYHAYNPVEERETTVNDFFN